MDPVKLAGAKDAGCGAPMDAGGFASAFAGAKPNAALIPSHIDILFYYLEKERVCWSGSGSGSGFVDIVD